jgi:TetR/AcrR family transcriptional repressor of lmrAB and yxaGH operons
VDDRRRGAVARSAGAAGELVRRGAAADRRAPGSIYHHFPGGKEQLVAAAVEAAGARAIGVLDGLAGATPERITEVFMGLWRLLLERTGNTAGCAVLAVTVATRSDELLDSAGALFRAWRARLADLFEVGGLSDPAAFAAALVAASEGAVVMARAERSLEPFDAMAGYLLGQVRAANAGRAQDKGSRA